MRQAHTVGQEMEYASLCLDATLRDASQRETRQSESGGAIVCPVSAQAEMDKGHALQGVPGQTGTGQHREETMNLTQGQVQRLIQADNRFHQQVAGRGTSPQIGAEEFVDDVLAIVGEAKCAPAPGEVACGAVVGGVQCKQAALLILRGRARCYDHRKVQ